MSYLVDALERAYRVLGLEDAAGGDEVFRHLVLARIIEPTSKLDSLRVLEEAGVTAAPYCTLKRRLPAYAEEERRQRLSAGCAAHARSARPAWCATTCPRSTSRPGTGDGFREPGFSRERRLEPQRRQIPGQAGQWEHTRVRRGWVSTSLDGGTGSVPASRVAVIEGSWRFRDHAEQQSRGIAHHLPGVSLLHPLGAEFLQPGYFGRQVVSVDIDMNPG